MTPDERRARAIGLYSLLRIAAPYVDADTVSLDLIEAELRESEARGWEEASACLGKRATYYSETQEVDRFTRAIQLNEVRGCIDALKQGAKQLREGT